MFLLLSILNLRFALGLQPQDLSPDHLCNRPNVYAGIRKVTKSVVSLILWFSVKLDKNVSINDSAPSIDYRHLIVVVAHTAHARYWITYFDYDFFILWHWLNTWQWERYYWSYQRVDVYRWYLIIVKPVYPDCTSWYPYSRKPPRSQLPHLETQDASLLSIQFWLYGSLPTLVF